MRKRLSKAKTSLEKEKTHLPSENVIPKAHTGLPGETEWKRGSERLKRLYKKNGARKGKKAFT